MDFLVKAIAWLGGTIKGMVNGLFWITASILIGVSLITIAERVFSGGVKLPDHFFLSICIIIAAIIINSGRRG